MFDVNYHISREEYNLERKNHLKYLRKGKFAIDLPKAYINADYKKDLEKNGYWYEALSTGKIKPITSIQEKFINVINGKSESIGSIGSSWIRYSLIKNNWGDVYTILKNANQQEIEILAKILHLKDTSLDSIILKLVTSSQRFSSLMGSYTSYSEIIEKVGKKLSIKILTKNTKQLEREIAQAVLAEALSKMSEEEKAKFEIEINKLIKGENKLLKTGSILATLTAANLSGFGVYLLATTTLGTLSGIIGVTLPFVAYTALTSSIAFLTGPAGWIGLGVYALWKFNDVDYKKLIPAIIYIHWLREKYENEVQVQPPILFENEGKKATIGKTKIEYKAASSILTPASGFMEEYDYTLNPYSGCSFGCTYCYAAFFSRNKEKMDTWGEWLSVKENALTLLRKKRNKPLIDKTIYISSVTDPYQPIEKDLELTRQILKELLEFHQVRLVIQTRSPMVTRDIDILKKFKTLQVNMTVTTDSEKVRKVFEPFCPGNKQRIKAIKKLHDAGIQSCITMTPLLPVENPEAFADDLLNTGIERFIIQPFHKDKGKFVRGTREEAFKILNEFNWGDEEYNRVLTLMRKKIPNLGIGKTGFAPI